MRILRWENWKSLTISPAILYQDHACYNDRFKWTSKIQTTENIYIVASFKSTLGEKQDEVTEEKHCFEEKHLPFAAVVGIMDAGKVINVSLSNMFSFWTMLLYLGIRSLVEFGFLTVSTPSTNYQKKKTKKNILIF